MSGPRTTGTPAAGAFGLDLRERTRVADRLDQAVRRARAEGRVVLAAVTLPAAGRLDPTPIAGPSRRPGERWFCPDHPDPEGFPLAPPGAVPTPQARWPR